jgi:hypothetical protein
MDWIDAAIRKAEEQARNGQLRSLDEALERDDQARHLEEKQAREREERERQERERQERDRDERDDR